MMSHITSYIIDLTSLKWVNIIIYLKVDLFFILNYLTCNDLVTWPSHLTWHTTSSEQFYEGWFQLTPKTPPPSDLHLIYDLHLRIGLLSMSTRQRFVFEKAPRALTPKDSDEQSFFIVNGGKAGRCHPRFTNRAGRGYPRSINGSASRCHPRTTIGEAMCRW